MNEPRMMVDAACIWLFAIAFAGLALITVGVLVWDIVHCRRKK